MLKKPIFKKIENSEKENPENLKDFEKLLIQNILLEMRDNSLIDSGELSMALNILFNKTDT